MWKQHPRNTWECLVCADGRQREYKHCAAHEDSQKHKAALQYHRTSSATSSADADNLVYEDRPFVEENRTAEADLPPDLYYPNSQNDWSEEQYDNYSESIYNEPPLESDYNVEDDTEHLPYSIEPTADELAIMRAAESLSSYSISGGPVEQNIYSEESDEYERDGDSSSDSSGTYISNCYDFAIEIMFVQILIMCLVSFRDHLLQDWNLMSNGFLGQTKL